MPRTATTDQLQVWRVDGIKMHAYSRLPLSQHAHVNTERDQLVAEFNRKRPGLQPCDVKWFPMRNFALLCPPLRGYGTSHPTALTDQ